LAIPPARIAQEAASSRLCAASAIPGAATSGKTPSSSRYASNAMNREQLRSDLILQHGADNSAIQQAKAFAPMFNAENSSLS
jgi:hypothetical protein